MSRHLKKALELYETFYQFEPSSVVESSLTIPKVVSRVGRMVSVMYASNKWERKTNYYKHDHESPVYLYEPGGGTKVPKFITSVDAMPTLGKCMGLVYDDGDGEKSVAFTGCDLYAIPSGKALVVVKGRRSVVALIWGGKLGVEGRGIVY